MYFKVNAQVYRTSRQHCSTYLYRAGFSDSVTETDERNETEHQHLKKRLGGTRRKKRSKTEGTLNAEKRDATFEKKNASSQRLRRRRLRAPTRREARPLSYTVAADAAVRRARVLAAASSRNRCSQFGLRAGAPRGRHRCDA